MIYNDSQHDPPKTPWGTVADRLLDDPSNPAGWSFGVFRLKDFELRIHLATPVFLIALLLSSIVPGNPGLLYAGLLTIGLVLALIVHSAGRLLAARLTGSACHRIVLLPWGSLPLWHADSPRGDMITAAGGVIALALVYASTATTLSLLDYAELIAPNPFDLRATLNSIEAYNQPVLLQTVTAIFLLQTAVFAIAAINALPIFPYDGSMFARAIASPRIGTENATVILANAGVILGGLLLLAGIALQSVPVLLISGIGIATSWIERRRPQALDELIEMQSPETLRESTEQRAQEQREQEQQELDQLLEKISDSGLDSLTRKERKRLEFLRTR
ncbi:MAG: DUF6576 domain-containing protein [Planctomycetota bacterium]